ncbi:MAG: guanitoxin biosynthesis heme-dependent pre-guanitoxin N-hydroxylase GntA [Flavobacteriales bacterium]
MAAQPLVFEGIPGRWTPEGVLAVIEAKVLGPQYPCLGARSAVRRGRVTVGAFGELGSAAAARDLVMHLTQFAEDVDLDAGFASLAAAFRGPVIGDERQFERLLWRQLQRVHDRDDQPWSSGVSPDPSSGHFGFSVGGRAYFVIGMHPRASRLARRTPFPILVFNLHEQFEMLRRAGQFEPMRDAIRRRDQRLQGDLNPMVDDHGRSSEARQYSGRDVGPGWAPDFRQRHRGPVNGLEGDA